MVAMGFQRKNPVSTMIPVPQMRAQYSTFSSQAKRPWAGGCGRSPTAWATDRPAALRSERSGIMVRGSRSTYLRYPTAAKWYTTASMRMVAKTRWMIRTTSMPPSQPMRCKESQAPS